MNRIYRHAWNKKQGAYVVAPETATARSKLSSRTTTVAAALLLTTGAAGAAEPTAGALPTGPAITAGQASISQAGNKMVITQSTDRAIANWNTFNIGRDAAVQVVQPGSNAALLNRVTSSDPSYLFGQLSANGRVFLINPSGIVFGSGARIDTGALVASTLNLADADFLADRLVFSGIGAGTINNAGRLAAASGGTVALIAPRIANTGTIEAPAGSAAALAGDQVTLTLAGNRLVSYAIDRGTLDGLIANGGAIRADEGAVILSARALDALGGAVVRNSGVIEARGISSDGGRVVLDAGAGGIAEITGSIDASGAAQGGRVSLLGDRVGLLAGAQVHADGGTGGGTVHVGGDRHGAGADPNATVTYVDAAATVTADAQRAGAGGDVTMWADDTTRFAGQISARGAGAGNGGQVEVSGKRYLDYAGQTDVRAQQGADGTLLLDPTDITISTAATANGTFSGGAWTNSAGTSASTILNTDLVNALNSGNVTISTSSAGGGNGDITVNAPIAYTGANTRTLTLQADRNIVLGTGADITSANAALDVTLSASNDTNATLGGVDVGANIRSNGGRILIGGGAGTMTYGIGFARNLATNGAAVQIKGNKIIDSGGGDITINGLSNYGTTKTGTYDSTMAGIYVLSGATITSGLGNVYMTGQQTASANTFGLAFEAASSTVTKVGPSLNGGNLLLNGVNSRSDAGALGLVNNGSVKRLYLSGITVANMGVQVNGSIQQVQYFLDTSACSIGSPHCGNLQVPGTNSSYLYAGYASTTAETKPIYVSTNDITKTYDGTNGLPGLLLSTLGAPSDYSTSGVSFGIPGKNVGQYVIKGATGNPITFASSDGNTYAVGYFGGLATINPQPITVSGAGATKVYDGTTAASGATAITSGSLATGDTAVLGGAYASANAGTNIAVTPTIAISDGNSGGNYAVTYVNGTGSITPRPLTVTANDQSKTYGDALVLNGTSGYTASGLQNNETIGAVTLTPTGGTAVTDSAGNYVIHAGSASGGTFNPSNYQISYADSKLTVNPRPLTVSGITAQDREYDGTSRANLTLGNLTFGGILNNDQVFFDVGTIAGTFADKNVGTNKAISLSGITLSGESAGNYTVAGVSGVTASITPRAISIQGTNVANKTYDGNTGAMLLSAGQIVNLVNGDSVTLDASSASAWFADKNAGTGKTVTVAGMALTGSDAANYKIATAPTTTATINQRQVIASGALAEDKVYDGNTSAVITSAGSLADVVSGDHVLLDLAGSTAAFVDRNAGTTKTVTITGLALSGTDAANYKLASSTATTAATITQRDVTVQNVGVSDKAYDGNANASLQWAGPVANMVAGDIVMVDTTSARAAFADKNAGVNKSVTVSGLGLTGQDAANYRIAADPTTTATIHPRAVGVTGTQAGNKTYDSTAAATLTAVGYLTDAISGDDVRIDPAALQAEFADKNAGSNKTVTVSGLALTGGDAANYRLLSSSATTTADITRRALGVTGATAADKTYDGNTSATVTQAGSLTSVIVGDDVSLDASHAAAAFADKNAGADKTVTISGLTLNGADAANYRLGMITTTSASIAKRTLTVADLAASDKVYDGAVNASLASPGVLTNAVTGETVALDVSHAHAFFADKNVGNNKPVTVDGLALSGSDAGNYTIATTATTSASITPRDLTLIGAVVRDKVYDGTVAASVGNAGTLGNAIAGDAVSLDASAASANFVDKNAGTNKAAVITGLGLAGDEARNYRITGAAPATGTIGRRALDVTGTRVENKAYDGTTDATLASAGNLANAIDGDQVALDTGTVRVAFADKNAGTGKAVAVSGLALSGEDAANYTLAPVSGATADIARRTLGVAGAIVASKVYDGAVDATLTNPGTLTNAVAGESVVLDAAQAHAAFADKNAGTNKAVTVDGLRLSGGDAANYVLAPSAAASASITPRVLTVTGTTVRDKVYDGTTAATLNAAGTLVNTVAGDAVGLDAASASAQFADKNAGSNKTVTVNGLALSGADAGNYRIAANPISSASIRQRVLGVAVTQINNKVYDGTTDAVLASAGTLTNTVVGDQLRLDSTAAHAEFADKNAGTGKTVTVGGLGLAGGDAGNYTLSAPAVATADIARRALSVTGAAVADKMYDGTTTASVTSSGSLTNVVAGDAVALDTTSIQATFSDKNVATGKTATIAGLALSGADAQNYVLASAATARADITPRALTVGQTRVANKVYDGTIAATLLEAGALSNVVAGDAVALTAESASAVFADKNAGSDKVVTVTGLALNGADAGNYRLAGMATATADIARRAVGATGVTVANKTYDGTATATITSPGTLTGVVAGDDVTISSAVATFADARPGLNKTVTVSKIELGGKDAGNYGFSAAGTTANITGGNSDAVDGSTRQTAQTPVTTAVNVTPPTTPPVLVTPPTVSVPQPPSVNVVSRADGSTIVFGPTKSFDPVSDVDTKSSLVQLVVIRPNTVPVLDKGYDVSVKPGQINLKPQDKVELDHEVPAEIPGQALASIKVLVPAKDGTNYEFTVELRPNGVGIKAATPEGTTFADENRDAVVGSSILELTQKANVPADRIKTVFLQLGQ